jgi:hypothetical protein
MPDYNDVIDNVATTVDVADKMHSSIKAARIAARDTAGKVVLKKAALKAVASPIEAGLMALEVGRLATDEELRLKRMKEAEELANESNPAMRALKTQVNPIGTIYGAGQAIYDTVAINAGQKDRDLEYELEKKRVMDRRAGKEEEKASGVRNEVRAFDAFNNRVHVEPLKKPEEDDKEIGLALVRSYFEGSKLI